jgi:hypothetical protein
MVLPIKFSAFNNCFGSLSTIIEVFWLIADTNAMPTPIWPAPTTPTFEIKRHWVEIFINGIIKIQKILCYLPVKSHKNVAPN